MIAGGRGTNSAGVAVVGSDWTFVAVCSNDRLGPGTAVAQAVLVEGRAVQVPQPSGSHEPLKYAGVPRASTDSAIRRRPWIYAASRNEMFISLCIVQIAWVSVSIVVFR